MVPVPKVQHHYVRKTTGDLWMMPVPKQHFANSAYHQKNKKDLSAVIHVTAGYPPVNLFCKAIDADTSQLGQA